MGPFVTLVGIYINRAATIALLGSGSKNVKGDP